MTVDSGMRIGGLFRCCIETISQDKEKEYEGRILKCLYCSDSVIFKDGAWEWNKQGMQQKNKT